MSSFISSFNREILVLLVALVVLGAVETAVRRANPPDKNYITALPQAFRAAAQEFKQKRSRTRLLIMGNSYMMAGVQLDALRQDLAQRGMTRLRCEAATVSASRVGEWYHLLKVYFHSTKTTPDAVVLGFTPEFLDDEAPFEVWHLPVLFPLKEVPEIFAGDLTHFDQRAELLLDYAMAAYCHRTEFRHLVLNRVVPDYQANLQSIYHAGAAVARTKADGTPASAGAPAEAPQYRKLRRLLSFTRERKIKLIMIAMPQRAWHYTVDPAVARLLQDYGASLIDAQDETYFPQTTFRDPWHLNEEGARRFTQRLGEWLGGDYGDLLRRPPRLAPLAASAQP